MMLRVCLHSAVAMSRRACADALSGAHGDGSVHDQGAFALAQTGTGTLLCAPCHACLPVTPTACAADDEHMPVPMRPSSPHSNCSESMVWDGTFWARSISTRFDMAACVCAYAAANRALDEIIARQRREQRAGM